MTLLRLGPAPQTSDPLDTFRGVPYYNSCYADFPLSELDGNVDYSRERQKALTCNTKDGVKPMNKEEQAAERSLNWMLTKKLAKSLLKMDFTNFSLPVGYSESRTFMERASDLFAFLVARYLQLACETADPPMRLSYIAIGVMAAFHLYLQPKKPWNPVIGETYVGQWENGVCIYGEQISHHPPITALQVRCPNDRWRIDAHFSFGIEQGVTSFDIKQTGPARLVFADGGEIEWEHPGIRASGILKGDRVEKVIGPFQMKDVKNGLEVFVEISPKSSKSRGITQSRASVVWGGIRPIGETKDVFIKKITGDYADTLFVDGAPIWNLSRDFAVRPNVVVEPDRLLLSDARFRIDRALVIQGDMEGAEVAKTLLEQLQRRDAKLRAAGPVVGFRKRRRSSTL
jgi:hypothetical protein